MAELRGRHFGFLGLLCTTWIAARIGFLTLTPNLAADEPKIRSSTTSSVAVTGNHPTLVSASAMSLKAACCDPAFLIAQLPRSDRNFSGKLVRTWVAPVKPPTAAKGVSPASGTDRQAASAIGPAVLLQLRTAPGGRLRLYAYSFWRPGSSAPALANGAQYGGSQSGFVATYALRHWPDGEEKLAMLLRGAIALGNTQERELAAGLRWRPVRALPFTISGERRFRANRPDAFAAYLAGGVSDVRLPLKFRLEGYGQGGVVSGKDGGAFFDFLARTDRTIVSVGQATISGGAGAWGGGQDDVRRLDIGPTMRADIALGNSSLRLSADWRFRIAGKAEPGDGPALTLSTNF